MKYCGGGGERAGNNLYNEQSNNRTIEKLLYYSEVSDS